MNHQIIPLAAMLQIVLIILVVCLFSYLISRNKYRLAELIVRSGQPIPDGFFDKKVSLDSSISLLKNGLICLAVGIGCAIFALIIHNRMILGLSSIPTLIGIAYIITSRIVGNKERSAIGSGEGKTGTDE